MIIDVRDAFYKIRIKEEEEQKTAFATRQGLFEFLIILFRLYSAPATFQAFINNILREYLNNFAITYLDNILIFSKTLEEYKEQDGSAPPLFRSPLDLSSLYLDSIASYRTLLLNPYIRINLPFCFIVRRTIGIDILIIDTPTTSEIPQLPKQAIQLF